MEKKDMMIFTAIILMIIALVSMLFQLDELKKHGEACKKVYEKYNVTEGYCDVCKVFCC